MEDSFDMMFTAEVHADEEERVITIRGPKGSKVEVVMKAAMNSAEWYAFESLVRNMGDTVDMILDSCKETSEGGVGMAVGKGTADNASIMVENVTYEQYQEILKERPHE